MLTRCKASRTLFGGRGVATFDVDEVQGITNVVWGGGGRSGGVGTFDVDEMQGIPYVVWGGGGRGGVVAFDVGEMQGIMCAVHPLSVKDPREDLRGCFCRLGEDWSHSLQSI